jgi:iron only hydrogenase large subunit-like protein
MLAPLCFSLGWVCYGEKLHQHALPKISKVKSHQQIMGSLIKLLYGPAANRTPDQIFHITLMSCFDRKLESSRKDFFYEEYKAKEVDVVLTSIEIEQILEKLCKKLEDFERVPLVDLFADGVTGTPRSGYALMSHAGSGSGGYAEFVMKTAAERLFNRKLDNVEWKVGRYGGQIIDSVAFKLSFAKELKLCNPFM